MTNVSTKSFWLKCRGQNRQKQTRQSVECKRKSLETENKSKKTIMGKHQQNGKNKGKIISSAQMEERKWQMENRKWRLQLPLCKKAT